MNLNLKELFALAKPYLEKNDFGYEHTKRVYEIAQKYFLIPENMRELIFSSIILHDIGGSSIKAQYQEGPRIARNLLEKLEASQDFIESVCDLIKTHHNHPNNPSLAFQILHDSDKLVMFSYEEFSYYNLTPNFNWDRVIEQIYSEEIKSVAKKLLQKRQTIN